MNVSISKSSILFNFDVTNADWSIKLFLTLLFMSFVTEDGSGETLAGVLTTFSMYGCAAEN